MFVFGNFLTATAEIISIILEFYKWVIIISAVLSWVNPDPYNPIVQTLHRMTDPVLNAVRRKLPFTSTGMDFSPIIVILAIIFLQSFLVRTLHSTGLQLLSH